MNVGTSKVFTTLILNKKYLYVKLTISLKIPSNPYNSVFKRGSILVKNNFN